MTSLIDPIGWSIILMLAGCVLVALEVFIPSGGIIGTISAVCFIASIIIFSASDGCVATFPLPYMSIAKAT